MFSRHPANDSFFFCFKLYSQNFAIAHAPKIVMLIIIGHTCVAIKLKKTFTVMLNPVVEHSDTLSFALLVYIILYINGEKFRCSVFTFAKYNYRKMKRKTER